MTGRPSLFRSILILSNLGVIIAYLIACIAPFTTTREVWILAFPGLVFPLIIFALLFFIILWVILKSKWWWISLLVLLLGFQQIMAVFAFNVPKKFSYDKKPNTLRVLQWNVSSWDENGKRNSGKSYQPLMMELIQKQNADVLCFEEYFDPITVRDFEPNIVTIANMGYPYHYFVATAYYKMDYEAGIVIFSKYPMIDSANYSFSIDNKGEHLPV